MNAIEKPDLDVNYLVNEWLVKFETALVAADQSGLAAVFQEDTHCRDVVALTWSITPWVGRRAVVDGWMGVQKLRHFRNFRIDAKRTAPRIVTRLGIRCVEAIIVFENDEVICHAVLRLPMHNPEQAWLFSTSLTEIKGHEEPINERRPTGDSHWRTFGGDNWADQRRTEQDFADRDPAVLIIGGSQFGVTLAARLRLLGVEALVIERTPRIGDVWRNRYHALALHNQVGQNHFPYMPFPPHWPKYLPKDMLANWIESYALHMCSNVWTSSTFVSGKYDEASGEWTAVIRRADGSERVLHPRHLVLANGVLGGGKRMPDVPGLEDFKGEIIHTHDYMSGQKWRGKKALVLGAGTSGHDAAQDLQGAGADVKLIQRGSTTVASLKAASFNNPLYYEDDIPIDDADLIGGTATFPLLKQGYQAAVQRMKVVDKDMIEGLTARGFKLDFGPDEAGHQMKMRVRHGGYYINCGCSDLIISGEVGLLQWENADRFVADGLLMKDGSVEKADLLVAATGYYSQEAVMAGLLGQDVATKVGPVWGLSPTGELNNMFTQTPQPGLWLMGGGLSHNRVYSRYVALQIKGLELGLHSYNA